MSQINTHFQSLQSLAFRALKYGVVGGISAIVDIIVVFFCAFELLKQSWQLSLASSLFCSGVVNFFLTRRRVYHFSGISRPEVCVFLLICAIAIFLNYALTFLMIRTGLDAVVTRVLTIVFVFAFNFYPEIGYTDVFLVPMKPATRMRLVNDDYFE